MKKSAIAVIVFLIMLQFIPAGKNTSNAPSRYAISQVPSDVQQILHASCYDCHSDNTNYPWYDNIRPVAWWVNSHINSGKRHLNFDAFDSLPAAKKIKALKHISSTVHKDEMPLSSYTLMHRSAVLSPEQKDRVVHWADSLNTSISKIHP